MNRISYCTVFLLLVISCAKSTVSSWEEGPRKMAGVSFSTTDCRTLDLCAFSLDGCLDVHVRQPGTELTAELNGSEPLYWYLIANAPEGLLDSVANISQLDNTELLLESTDPDHPVMVGKGMNLFQDGSEKTVIMNRVPCKVSIGFLSPLFLDTGTAEPAEAYLDRIFLINAPASIPLSLQPSADMLRNPGGLEPDLPDGLAVMLCRDLSLRLAGTETCSLDTSLYCFPNPLGNACLVLELSIEGRKNYYPIPIPSMKSNVEYHVEEIVLLGDGSPSPSIPVARTAIAYDVTVHPWNTVETTCMME